MEQCDDDMSEYFRFLEENWRSIVSASGIDNISGSEAQDLVYDPFSDKVVDEWTKSTR